MTYFYTITLLFLSLILLSYSFSYKVINDRRHRLTRQVLTLSSMNEDGGDNNMMSQEMRSTVPSRNDMCRVFISGIVGFDAKEQYLKNGHYVINFSLAVVGHFKAIHDWERYKPTETMWVNAEIWDEEAKSNLMNIRKGTSFGGIGYMIGNKWIDKNSGEEKKSFKMRILKAISPSELNQIFGPLEEVFSSQESFTDPAFDQTNNDNNSYQQSPYQRNRPYQNNNNMNANTNTNGNNMNNNNVNNYGNKKRQQQISNDDQNDNNMNQENDEYLQNRDPRIPF